MCVVVDFEVVVDYYFFYFLHASDVKSAHGGGSLSTLQRRARENKNLDENLADLELGHYAASVKFTKNFGHNNDYSVSKPPNSCEKPTILDLIFYLFLESISLCVVMHAADHPAE